MKPNRLKQNPNSGSHQSPSGGLSLPAAAGLVVIIAAGFLIGRFVPTAASDDSATATSPPPERPAPRAAEVPPPPVLPRSTDTLDDLLAADPASLYSRLALWLVHASADDIAAYWQAVQSLKAYPDNARRLVFLRWTMLDPQAAIAAVAGTRWADLPWSAWARHEPLAAFQFAKEQDPSRLEAILATTGKTDPRLAQQLLQDHPDFAAKAGVSGILTGLTRTDPKAAMEFAAQHLASVEPQHIEAWLRDDPHATVAWLLAHQDELEFFTRTPGFEKIAIESLQREQPETLRELAAQCPPGDFRRQLEEAIFERFLEQDPDAARAAALANPSPAVAAGQLIKIAMRDLAEHPEKAFDSLDAIRQRLPDFPMQVDMDFGGFYTNAYIMPHESAVKLIDQWVRSQPEALMARIQHEAIAPDGMNDPQGMTSGMFFERATKSWAEHDPDALARWAHEQTPELREEIFDTAISQFRQNGKITEAMQFAARSGDENLIRSTLRDWHSFDPEGAVRWAEANGISIEQP